MYSKMLSRHSRGSASEAEVVVRRYYELVDAQEFAAMAGLFSDDVVYRRPGYDPMAGVERLLAFYRNDRVIESGEHEVHTLVSDGTVVAVAGAFRGTIRGGQQIRQRFSDFFVVVSGRISARSTYFDAPAI